MWQTKIRCSRSRISQENSVWIISKTYLNRVNQMLILLKLKCKDIIKAEAEHKKGENRGSMRQVIGILCFFNQGYEKVTIFHIYNNLGSYSDILKIKFKTTIPIWEEWAYSLLLNTASGTADKMAEVALIWSIRFLVMTLLSIWLFWYYRCRKGREKKSIITQHMQTHRQCLAWISKEIRKQW